VSIAPIVNFQRQIATLKVFRENGSQQAYGFFIGRKLVAEAQGTDLGSFAKMVQLLPQPARP
jgi:hypothetical protein